MPSTFKTVSFYCGLKPTHVYLYLQVAESNDFLTKFGINHILESCENDCRIMNRDIENMKKILMGVLCSKCALAGNSGAEVTVIWYNIVT